MRRKPLLLSITLPLAIVVAAPAFASITSSEHYRWKDTAGVVHFSDTIPASALPLGYDIVDNQGRVIRHVERELTPAERHAAAAEAARQAAAKRAVQQQNLEDAQLLAAYPTDKSLQDSQQGDLKQIEVDIATLEGNLKDQETALTDMLAHAADLQHAGKPVPPFVNKNIAAQRDSVNTDRTALERRRADLARAKLKFAAQLQRYRALRAKYQAQDDASS